MRYSNYFFVPVLFLFLLGLANLSSCKKDKINPNAPQVDFNRLPYETLSEYNFFAGDMKDLSPNEEVVPYDLNSPLFSDYADKSRFVWMPNGQTASYTGEGLVDFPIGTIIIKTFYFNNDLRDPSLGRNIIETRLLIRQDTAWQQATYIWNAAQDEADFNVSGRQITVNWTHFDGAARSTNYYIPNKNDCKGCHNVDSKLLPIGPKARNLNKDFAYADGPMNQLEKWQAVGYLQNVPTLSQVAKLPNWKDPATGDLNARARAYLEINCAHCHNLDAPADNSGLLLDYNVTDMTDIGVCKSPTASGAGSGSLSYVIVPGQPDESIMVYRMESTEIDVAMPELARSVRHDEGVDLIREWISTSLTGSCK